MVDEQFTIIATILASTLTILASVITGLIILYRSLGRVEGGMTNIGGE